ncbi:hypothetical protein D7S86_19885 [Pararobbsia silviterrae]|uniref:Uncharacterized protein n=1 Tax=Pararobbsia silviterrae TaxID=1792498 RepID=A0A494XLM6_9BURK|nr:hypothetical protein D7S86_19885 [Pararobbsia silviterrae]
MLLTHCTAEHRRLSIDIQRYQNHRLVSSPCAVRIDALATYKVSRDRTRASVHTGAHSPTVGGCILETIMAKGQLRGNREPKKPKQPKKPVVLSTLGLPAKPIRPVTKNAKDR